MPPNKKKLASRGAELLLGTNWAIQSDALDAFRAAIDKAQFDPAAIMAKPGEWLERTYNVTMRDGVAIVPVRGILTRHWSFWSWIFGGGCNYEELARDVTVAVEDPNVRAIVLDVDSPGGEISGLADCAALIASYRGRKPITAHVGGSGTSAAYWLASAAESVVASETAILGSIGVVVTYYDFSKLEKALGIKRIELVSSQSPRKRVDIRTAEGQAEVVAVLDALADVFIRDVASYRGVSPDTVQTEFGQGGVFVGSAAVDAGLADSVATLEQVHQELAAESAPRVFTLSAEARRMPPTAAADPNKVRAEDPHKDDEEQEEGKGNKAADEPVDEEEEEEEEDEETPEGLARFAAKHPKAVAHFRAAGATAERERLTAIDALAAPGLEAVIAEAKADPACTAEGAAFKILAAQRAAATKENSPATQHLSALKKDEQSLDAPSGAAGQHADSETQAEVSRIVRLHSQFARPSATARRN